MELPGSTGLPGPTELPGSAELPGSMELPVQRIWRPEIARAMTSRWISLVPSKIV